VGGFAWAVGVTTLGYLFGNIPWVKGHLSQIIWAMILLPGLVIAFGAWRARSASVQPG